MILTLVIVFMVVAFIFLIVGSIISIFGDSVYPKSDWELDAFYCNWVEVCLTFSIISAMLSLPLLLVHIFFGV